MATSLRRLAAERLSQGALGGAALLCFHLLERTKRPNCESASQTDQYPNFTRHGDKSLLRLHLTPKIYSQLCQNKTSNGVTLEDIIQSGVSLPLGADPPRGIGVYCGDAESYKVFAPLLESMIAQYHGTAAKEGGRGLRRMSTALKRHSTNLNPEAVLSQRPDPSGDYILFTRMRLARSIEGFPFAPAISRSDRRYLESLVKECVKDWKGDNLLGNGDAKYMSVYEMTNTIHEDLVRRHLLFTDPNEWKIYSGIGRDWPDGRGVYLNSWSKTPNIMIWCNDEDHLRILVMGKGGDLYKIFSDLSRTSRALEESLQKRGHKFSYDKRLGFLNTCPTNLGTALRASVYVKLVRLGRQPGFADLVKRLRLDIRNRYGTTDKHRYTGIFDIANAERLGKSEVQLINIMIQGVAILIELEKKLENGEHVDLSKVAQNRRYTEMEEHDI
jgi:creatine kinase